MRSPNPVHRTGDQVAEAILALRPMPRLAARRACRPWTCATSCARSLAPGQVRGVSWLAPALLRLHELDQYEDATLVRAKVAVLEAHPAPDAAEEVRRGWAARLMDALNELVRRAPESETALELAERAQRVLARA
jgi:hypothetical protein